MTGDLPHERDDELQEEIDEAPLAEDEDQMVARVDMESSGPLVDAGMAPADDQASKSVPVAADAPPTRSTEQDLSGFVEIPGPGRVDQAGWELMQLVYGLKPPFEPDTKNTDAPPLEPPSFLARLQQADAGPHFAQNNLGAAPQVIVELRVALTADALEQVSNDPIRKAAGHSRGETLIVGRKLEDLIREIRQRELQRRILWDRFRY